MIALSGTAGAATSSVVVGFSLGAHTACTHCATTINGSLELAGDGVAAARLST